MKRSVLKFGGSSVSDFTKIKNIAEMLKDRIENGETINCSCQCNGKTTDQLMENVAALTAEPKQQELPFTYNGRAANGLLPVDDIE